MEAEDDKQQQEEGMTPQAYTTWRQTRVFMAKLAEQAERYEEMLEEMTAVVRSLPMVGASAAEQPSVSSSACLLRVEERNLFGVAVKNLVGARRASWRILRSIAQKGLTDLQAATARTMTHRVEFELNSLCQECLNLIDDCLLPTSEHDPESQVYYTKMKSDMYRYIAEYSTGDAREAVNTALIAATQACQTLSRSRLEPTHPIRLGMALSWSVWNYEILGRRDVACQLAKEAFDDALAHLDQLGENEYREATLIMQLLRDNLTLWTSSAEDPAPESSDWDETHTTD